MAKIDLEKLKAKLIEEIGFVEWMNQCNFIRLRKYVEDKMSATIYNIFIINPDQENGLTEKEILSITNTLRNALKKHPHVRILIVKSTTKRRGAERVKEKTNGRYRTVIKGTKVPTHLHIGCIGDTSRSARDYVQHVTKLLRKRGISSKYDSITSVDHKQEFVRYCHRQADTFHEYGNRKIRFKDCIWVD